MCAECLIKNSEEDIKPTLASESYGSCQADFLFCGFLAQSDLCDIQRCNNLHLEEKGRMKFAWGVFLGRVISSSHQRFTGDFEEKVVYVGPCVQDRLANQRK